MALSSDEIIKREIIEKVGYKIGNLKLRIFPESSNDDQVKFTEGGLTFSYDDVNYGSCDACYYKIVEGETIPIIAIEGTDALNRNSSGNAQYQRFHHALGAVKNGYIGIYYLKKGIDKIQEDLFGIAYFASQKEKGTYLVTDDLDVIKTLLEKYDNQKEFDLYLQQELQNMYAIFEQKFLTKYKGDWNVFADKRSTIIKDDYIIKHAGRMKRNFTDGSQRAGHIAVGEMYLTKYYFYDKKFYYLFPRMTRAEVEELDVQKADDKEWYLLRHEPNVEIKTMEEIIGLPDNLRKNLLSVGAEPLKGEALRLYTDSVKVIVEGLKTGKMQLLI